MKRFLCILLISAICFSLAACSNPDDVSDDIATSTEETVQSKEKDVPAENLELNKEITVDGYAKITLKSVSSTDSVKASMGSIFEYKVDSNSNVYADAVFDIEYIGEKEVICGEFMSAAAFGDNDMVYEDVLYCVEKDNMTSISSYETIKPLSSVRFHTAFEVPKTESELTLTFDINGEKYSLDYTIGEDVRDSVAISEGEILGTADYATMEFVGVEVTESLLPANTEGYYSPYTVSNTENIYLAVKYNITNHQAEAKDCNTFAGITAVFDGKYKYTGIIVTEDDDEKGFSAYDSINSLETKKLFCLIEVPKTVIGMNYDVNILFEKTDYVYSGIATFDTATE